MSSHCFVRGGTRKLGPVSAVKKNYWLVKSEPSTYGIDAFKKDKRTPWEGVRNYQARNHMRDGMAVGDLVLFYHSSAEPTGVAGIAKVASKPHADETQFDKSGEYFDPKATREAPRWMLVDLAFVEAFKAVVSRDAMAKNPKLKDMVVLQRGQRPSVQPVRAAEFAEVLKMAGAKTKP